MEHQAIIEGKSSDSRLKPEYSFVEQFNLLRVVDNERYPGYFEHKTSLPNHDNKRMK